MGWATLPKPGTKTGPCKEECKHVDCNMTKKDAAKLCKVCNKPIGYDRPYYIDGGGLVHAQCIQ
jgi:hypothetical protein